MPTYYFYKLDKIVFLSVNAHFNQIRFRTRSYLLKYSCKNSKYEMMQNNYHPKCGNVPLSEVK